MSNENCSHNKESVPVFEIDEMLARLGNDFSMAQIIGAGFLKDMEIQIDKLNNAIREKDFKLASRIAHTIKGAAGNIGGKRMQQASGTIEKSNDNEDFRKNFILFEKEFKKLKTELVKKLAL